VTLRILDVDFDYNQLLIHNAKGGRFSTKATALSCNAPGNRQTVQKTRQIVCQYSGL
jgi:hypothetical protein